MAVTPKADRTSAVVAGTLILLTVLGVLTVFWEPLAAIAQGGPHGLEGESAAEARAPLPDAGVAPPADASSNS
jgi:hypothetical protein